MQLNSYHGSKAAGMIALAAVQLVGSGLTRGRAQADDLKDWTVEHATLVYRETNRVNVVEPVLRITRQLPGEQSLSLKAGFDAMSGASPNGMLPTHEQQTFTSPSGNSYTATPGELPQRQFRDERFSLSLDWTRPWARLLTGTAGLNASFETDYTSLGASYSLAWEINDRHTTLNLGLSHNHDTVNPEGNLPRPLKRFDGPRSENSSDTKDLSDLLLGVTQVMNDSWLVQFNLGVGRDSGYLTEPYKGVTRLDEEGQLAGGLSESRPEDRLRHTILLRNAYHLGRDVVHLTLRHYADDWGTQGQSLDLKYWWKPDQLFGSEGWILRPHLRLYHQQAADHYHLWVVEDQLPEYASADPRLGDLDSYTVGMRIDLPSFSWGQAWIKPEFMRQSWSIDSAVPASLQGLDLVPDLDVWMVSFGINTRF